MLYDPKWEKNSETKTDPFSLKSLIAWLEQQPAEKTYCWVDAGHCLLGQFVAAMGAPDVVNRSLWMAHSDPFGSIALDNPYTFGAALERARTALADRT